MRTAVTQPSGAHAAVNQSLRTDVEAVRVLLAKGADVNAASIKQPRLRNGLIAIGK